MRLTVVGCSGSYPGPDSPASCYLLEADHTDAGGAAHLADPARPRQRRARRAAALRRPARHRRGPAQPPARRPLPGPGRLLRAAQVPPRRRRSRGSRSGARPAPPTGWRAPTTCRVDPGMHAGVRLPRPTAGRSRSGPFAVEPGRRSSTRCRRSGCGSPRTAPRSPTAATPAPAPGLDARRRGRRPAARGGVVPRRRRQPRRPAPDRRRLRRRGRPRGGAKRLRAHPRAAVARPAGGAGRGRRALRRPAGAGRAPAPSTTSDAPGRRSGSLGDLGEIPDRRQRPASRPIGQAGPMIKVEGLTRTYGEFTAVDDVSFVCRPGTVTGFLGPNGAGKTTTMRVMVGLTPATSGGSRSAGTLRATSPTPGGTSGVLLDASAQHAGRTGREILEIGARTMGLPSSRVDEMLELVSLDARGVQAPAAQLLARHEAAARHRARPARRPVGADPRRARQRPRPGRHPLDARPAQGVRRPRRHRAAVQPPAARGRADRRRDDPDRPAAGSWPAAPAPSCSQAPPGGLATTLVTALDNDELSAALSAKGLPVSPGRRRPPGHGASRSTSGRRRGREGHRPHRPARRRRGRPRGPVPRADLRRRSATT